MPTVMSIRADCAEVSPCELRHAVGHFATGVAVVTSLDGTGAPVGTTANSITSLSLDPPLVLVCFDHASMTLHALRDRGAFAINVLAAHHRETSMAFAKRGSSDAWEKVRHDRGATGSPWLRGVLATLECLVEHSLPGGDHEIVVGRVLAVHTSDEDHKPLLFYRGAYATLESA
jgi:flavin reductase (DIM6/NTAB) family NADH-FMN oxidoreductase RutF